MNPHLNIFRFFNGNDEHHLEDNLSRGFALCLKYDTNFLDQILRSVLTSEEYERLFNTDFPDYEIRIDLQNRVDQLEGFSNIIGVACSGVEVSEFSSAHSRDTTSPETDVCIQINDTCILFEFKRTSEDCASQLKRQAELAAQICGTKRVRYIDLSWRRIIKILLNVSSLQKQISSENPFSADFIRFLEQFTATWFPSRRLVNIPFSTDENSPNARFLMSRLNQIKREIGKDNVREYLGKYSRLSLIVNYGWINEINIDPAVWEEEDSIAVRIHFGDTKGQGHHFFKTRPDGVEWGEKIAGYDFNVIPYLKISDAYGSALFWICPSSYDEIQKTHTKEFFEEFAGRWEKSAGKWERAGCPDFEHMLSKYIPDWKERCFISAGAIKVSWDEYLTYTGRTQFLLSVGTFLQVFVPYQVCQQQDDSMENPQIVHTFKNIINDIVKKVDSNVQTI